MYEQLIKEHVIEQVGLILSDDIQLWISLWIETWNAFYPSQNKKNGRVHDFLHNSLESYILVY